MDSRIVGKFLVASGSLESVETRKNLDTMILSSLGYDSDQNGRTVELTVTVKTTTDKPWPHCRLLDRWGTCNAYVEPGQTCQQTHYHKPDFDENGDCRACIRLGITPQSETDRNHRNKNAD